MAGMDSGQSGWLLRLARLGLTLLLAVSVGNVLWQTFLVNISARPVATALITEMEVEYVSPSIAGSSHGMSEIEWVALQMLAAFRPTAALPIAGLRVKILGKDIAGKSYADGMRVIYTKVASAYYEGGPDAVFEPGSVWARQFDSLNQLAPGGLSAQGGAVVQQIPFVGPGFLSAALPLLTAKGHAEAVTRDNWSIGVAAALALLLALVSRGWGRLANVAVGGLLGTLPGVAVIGLVAYMWQHSPQLFQSNATLLRLLGDQLAPLYLAAVGATLTGIAAAIAGAIAARIFARRKSSVAPAAARPRDQRAEREADRGGRGREPFGPPPPPASRRLALPSEGPADDDAPTEPDMPGLRGDADAR